MNNPPAFKQKLAAISRLWNAKDYDAALAHVEAALKTWPGNAHLHVLRANLVQLQEKPKHGLDEVRDALRQAVEFETRSPTAAVELGHFLDNVDDDPQAACKSFAEGVGNARRILIEGLIGQAKALRQLNKRDECVRCLLEAISLAQFEAPPKRAKTEGRAADVLFDSPLYLYNATHLQGPYAEQIQELVSDLVAGRSV